MTDDPASTSGTEGARELLEHSQHVLTDLMAGLSAMSARLSKGELVGEADMVAAVEALAAMRTTLMKEVERHEAHVRDTQEGCRDTVPLDLDDSRARIARRLDRLRNSRGTG